MKVFLFDAAKCNGCYGCQIACKDEHCEQDWSPYAAPQPITGQYWLKLNEEERGRVPFVHVDYKVGLCGHCDSCKLLVMAGDDDTVYQRDDGFILIDPEKARGRRAASACLCSRARGRTPLRRRAGKSWTGCSPLCLRRAFR